MPYATDRRGFSRTGFRPALTDTFAAAQGLGRTPFDPERLGQYHPFESTPGYHLRGLGSLGNVVPNGAVLTYQGQWTASYFDAAQDILNAVSAALTADGFIVASASQSSGLLGSSIFGMTIQPGPFNVTLQLQVNNGMGYSDPSDVLAIINHEVSVASGTMPVSGTIPTVQAPGGIAQATGQPGAPIGVASDWNSWLQQNAIWLGLGLVGVVLLPDLLEKF